VHGTGRQDQCHAQQTTQFQVHSHSAITFDHEASLVVSILLCGETKLPCGLMLALLKQPTLGIFYLHKNSGEYQEQSAQGMPPLPAIPEFDTLAEQQAAGAVSNQHRRHDHLARKQMWVRLRKGMSRILQYMPKWMTPGASCQVTSKMHPVSDAIWAQSGSTS
jgi:hypothetical protein